MLAKLDDFKGYSPKKPEVIEVKKEILTDAEMFFDYRNKVIEAFEDRIFLFKDRFAVKEPDVSNKKLPDWVRVDRTTFNQIKDKVKTFKDKNIYFRPNRGFYQTNSKVWWNHSLRSTGKHS